MYICFSPTVNRPSQAHDEALGIVFGADSGPKGRVGAILAEKTRQARGRVARPKQVDRATATGVRCMRASAGHSRVPKEATVLGVQEEQNGPSGCEQRIRPCE